MTEVVKPWQSISYFLAGLFFSCFTLADTILVTDRTGKPVANAVVSTVANDKKAAEPATAIMDQRNKNFVPHVLVVEAGQAVSFPNSDNIRHHVYSFSKPNQFEIKLYSGKSSAPQIFNHAGIVTLGCNIHDQMKGYIYVTDGEAANVSSTDGLVELPATTGFVHAWHPDLEGKVTERLKLPLQKGNAKGEWKITLPFEAQEPSPGKGYNFRDRFR